MYSKEEMKAHFSMCKDTHDGGFNCLCNCHNDTHSSAHHKIGNKGWVARCKSCGATGKEIYPRAGIAWDNIFKDEIAVYKTRSPNWMAYVEGREKHRIEAVYNYVSINGNYAFTKIRLEGKKDVDTLTKQGYTAFAYGGVNDWQSAFATLVQGAEVFILADNDEQGKRVANDILNGIRIVAKSAKVIVPAPDIPKGDIPDFFANGHNKQEFEQM